MSNTKASFALSLAAASLAASVAVGGCTEQSHQLSSSERQSIAKHVSNKAPTPEHPLHAVYEDKIELLGYSVHPDVWKEGQKIEVTWYWKCDAPLEEGWQLFTHVADASGKNRLNQDSVGTIRELYPPGQWKAGQYITDVQDMVLPMDWNSPSATLFVGVWNGPHRLHVVKGPNDGDNRVRVFTIRTEAAPAAAKAAARAGNVPVLRAMRVKEKPVIDGSLDDAVWKQAQRTSPLVNTLTGAPAQPPAVVRAAWDDTALYIAFEVKDDYLKSTFDKHDDHLWEQDAVEVMADPGGDARNYFEMQVSPKGVVFDTRYDTPRMPRPFGHIDWDSHMDVKVAVHGKVNDDEPDQGYTVEMAIPWKSFAVGSPPASPPTAGTQWRMNFYVMDARKEGQRAVGWSPTRVNDFHVPSRFGRVVFVDPAAAAGRAAPNPAVKKLLEQLKENAAKRARKPAPAAAPAKKP